MDRHSWLKSGSGIADCNGVGAVPDSRDGSRRNVRPALNRAGSVTLNRWVGNALVALAAALFGICSPAGTEASAPDRAATRSDPAASPGRAGTPMQVLARVGSHRRITREDLDRALSRSEPPSGSDSSLHTPEDERRFLELLIDREVLAETASREPWVDTREEAAAIEAIRDRRVLSGMLAIVLAETRSALAARGDSADDAQAGLVARDWALARAEVTFDSVVVERMAQAWAALPRPVSDSSLTAQIRILEQAPRVAAEDLDRPIATGTLGPYRVADLLASWGALSAAYRPRVESGDQIRDLVRNGLFERWLRLAAAEHGLGDRPEVRAAVARAREDQAIARYVEREVESRVPVDSAAVAAYHRAHASQWDLPLRVRVVGMTAAGREEAERMAVWLRDRAAAERLEKLARERGVDYVVEVSARSDSALFARALAAGTDAVLGPEPRGAEWWVGRVLAVLPGRARTLDEVWTVVERRWRANEQERMLRELCARLREGIGVRFEPGAPWSDSITDRAP